MDFEEKMSIIYAQPEIPAFLSEKYAVISCLKSGETKQIYVIEDTESGEKFILKSAEGEYADLLEKEYSVLERAQGVAKCPEPVLFKREDKAAYLVREYISGDTISDVVEKQPMSEDKAFSVMKKLCAELEKLHSLEPPIILRDIKPENIVISGEECIIIDFDAAREWRENASADTEYVGTRTTAAPEQFGYSQTDVRTDIYALGMLLAYMETGGYEISEIPWKKSDKIARKCTQFSPDERYKSVSAVCEAMKSRTPKILAITAAVLAGLTVVFFGIYHTIKFGDKNEYKYTKQASSLSDEMVTDALDCVDKQAGGAVRLGRTKREMIEFMLKDSQYAVFGGENWPCIASTNEADFIEYVTDLKLTALDGTKNVRLDSNSSGSMSTGWYVTGLVYTEPVSMESYRIYVEGLPGEYTAEGLRDYFKANFQAGEHIRIDETRSMSFVSCNDDGFYFIEYGSSDNSDRHLRFRYYTFEDFTNYINTIKKRIWYYEVIEEKNL